MSASARKKARVRPVPAEVEAAFSAGGLLARVLPGWEPRETQALFAREVAEILATPGWIAVEAPTGTGKSLAYLVPLLAWSAAGGGRAVVSTQTKNLQDQLLGKDVPLALRVVGLDLPVAVLKGRANYLCRTRLERARRDAPPAMERALLEVERWSARTGNGDLSECPALASPGGAAVAARVASEAIPCARHRGPEEEEGCFFRKAREEASRAALVIVNHALLSIDLLSGGGLLPAYAALVVDEAQHLVPAATDRLSLSLGMRRLVATLEPLIGGAEGGPGALGLLRAKVRKHDFAGKERLESEAGRLETAARATLARGKTVFAGSPGASPAGRGAENGGRRRYRDRGELEAILPSGTEGLTELETALEDLALAARGLRENLPDEGLPPEIEDVVLEAAEALDPLGELASDARDLFHAGSGTRVFWMERESRETVTLRGAPLSVARELGAALGGERALLLTSATLGPPGDLEPFLEQVGLAGRAVPLILPTTFPFEETTRVLATRAAPDPREAAYAGWVARALRDLVLATGVKAMALFTSHAALGDARGALAPLADEGVLVLAQEPGGSRTSLLARFREADRAILLGAASFWEGVDLPGEELELLVLARLPFAVPDDPIVQARSEILVREGRDPFREYSLPDALLRYRQGFGRLVRRREDGGAVVVLDPRILTKPYGRRFREAVPAPLLEAKDGDDLVAKTAAFLEGRRSAEGRGPRSK